MNNLRWDLSLKSNKLSIQFTHGHFLAKVIQNNGFDGRKLFQFQRSRLNSPHSWRGMYWLVCVCLCWHFIVWWDRLMLWVKKCECCDAKNNSNNVELHYKMRIRWISINLTEHKFTKWTKSFGTFVNTWETFCWWADRIESIRPIPQSRAKCLRVTLW